MDNLFKSIINEDDMTTQQLTKDGNEKNKQISDVGFSLIKNAINSDSKISSGDVFDYLKKADEINDEVDTIVFGLEDDQGDIVKVYVAKEDADGFEKELSQRLGKDDDIEELLAELASEFDIVDVEWPEDEEAEEETPTDSDQLDFDTQNTTGEESSEAEYELDFDENTPVKEGNEMSIIEKFKQKTLLEAAPKKLEPADFPAEVQDLLKTLTSPSQQKILYLISLFGLPKEVLGSKKSVAVFRKNLIAMSREYQKNQTLKIWVNRLSDELAPKKSDEKKKEEELAEAALNKDEPTFDITDPKMDKAEKFRDTLPRGVPRLIFDVLIGLGVPQTLLVDINRAKVRESIRDLTRRVKRTQRIHIYLNLIAETLKIKKDDQNEIAAHVTEEELAEAVTDKFSVLAEEIALALGIPQENISYKNAQVLKSIREKKKDLNWQPLLTKMEKFLDVIGDHTITKEVTEDIEQNQEIKNIFKQDF